MDELDFTREYKPAKEQGKPVSEWRRELRDALKSVEELGSYLGVEMGNLPADSKFPVLVPRGFADRMVRGDSCDPLLKQVLSGVGSATGEAVNGSEFLSDPVNDIGSLAVPGLVHKYSSRVLLTVTGRCAVHCQYCFRQHFPYGENVGMTDAQLEYIATNEIREVILSGGDPLTLSTKALTGAMSKLLRIASVRMVRIHSRVPIVLPSRVTEDLLELFGSHSGRMVLVVHCNHPQELSPAVSRSLKKLGLRGIQILNQAVLLRTVNDSLAVQEELSWRLVECGVVPYYVHQLDKVTGAEAFYVDPNAGIELFKALRARLPGYAVPRYVVDNGKRSGKTILA